MVLLQRHFYYEMRILIDVLNNHDKLRSYYFDGNIGGVILTELTLLHARNLLEFFYHPPKRDYARAADFMAPGITWDDIRPAKTRNIKTVEKEASIRLAHLTYKRDEVDVGYDCFAIRNDLNEIGNIFFDNVDQIYLNERLTELRVLMNQSRAQTEYGSLGATGSAYF